MKRTTVDGIVQPLLHGLMRSDIAVAADTSRTLRRRAARGDGGVVANHRVGIISNARSHRNRKGGPGWGAAAGHASDILYRTPRTMPELSRTLLEFADAGIELLVVDGGDGTLRDVITCAGSIFPGPMPRIAIVPSGKTNALAIDLGIPSNWTVHDALGAAGRGNEHARSPIEITRRGSHDPDLRGFLFGAGAFVRATALAQRTHKAGAFEGLAVGLSLVWAIAQTAFGGRDNEWRAGEVMRIRPHGGEDATHLYYLLLASTLAKLPLNLKPFGRVREGLKVLAVDAPVQRLLAATPAILAGSNAAWLEEAGYHRGDSDAFDLTLDGGFILDGELYAGGELTIRRGTPLRFVVP